VRVFLRYNAPTVLSPMPHPLGVRAVRVWADANPLHHAVISHLSVGEHAMDEEGFQRTMRYIFTFIEKVTAAPIPPRTTPIR